MCNKYHGRRVLREKHSRPPAACAQLVLYYFLCLQLLRRLDDEPDDGEEMTATTAPPSPVASGKKHKKSKQGNGDGRGVVVVKMDQLKKDVQRVLYAFNDANCLPLARKKIERLGVPPRLLDGL